MRLESILVIAAVVIGGACSGESEGTSATTTSTTVPVAIDAGGNPIDFGRLCVHTDPGQLPISVHRALNCPDGTMVSVTGVVTHRSDGSVLLCDTPADDSCLAIDDASAGSETGAPIDYTGTVSKGVLTVATSPAAGPGPLESSPINRP